MLAQMYTSPPRPAWDPEVILALFVFAILAYILFSAFTLRVAAWILKSRLTFPKALLIAFVACVVSLIATMITRDVIAGARFDKPNPFINLLSALPAAILTFFISAMMCGSMAKDEYRYPVGFGKGALISLVQTGLSIAVGITVGLVFYVGLSS